MKNRPDFAPEIGLAIKNITPVRTNLEKIRLWVVINYVTQSGERGSVLALGFNTNGR